MNTEAAEREWTEVLAMTELARAAHRIGVPVVSSGSEAGLRHVSLAAGHECHVAVYYPSWLAERPSHVSYQVDVTRHGKHLGSFLSGIQPESGIRRIVRLMEVISQERPLLREIAGWSSEPIARSQELFGTADPSVLIHRPGRDRSHGPALKLVRDPSAKLASACELVRCSPVTDIVPEFAIPEWLRSRDTGQPIPASVLGTRMAGECDALIVHAAPSGTTCASYRDTSTWPMESL